MEIAKKGTRKSNIERSQMVNAETEGLEREHVEKLEKLQSRQQNRTTESIKIRTGNNEECVGRTELNNYRTKRRD